MGCEQNKNQASNLVLPSMFDLIFNDRREYKNGNTLVVKVGAYLLSLLRSTIGGSGLDFVLNKITTRRGIFY